MVPDLGPSKLEYFTGDIVRGNLPGEREDSATSASADKLGALSSIPTKRSYGRIFWNAGNGKIVVEAVMASSLKSLVSDG
jgi:hypothetical protein